MFFSITVIAEDDEICPTNLSFNTEDNTEWNKLEVQPESLGENSIHIAMNNAEKKSLIKYVKENIPSIARLVKENCTPKFRIDGKIKVNFLIFSNRLLNKSNQL